MTLAAIHNAYQQLANAQNALDSFRSEKGLQQFNARFYTRCGCLDLVGAMPSPTDFDHLVCEHAVTIGTVTCDGQAYALLADESRAIVSKLEIEIGSLVATAKRDLERVRSGMAALTVESTQQLIDEKASLDLEVSRASQVLFDSITSHLRSITGNIFSSYRVDIAFTGYRDSLPSGASGVYLLWRETRLVYVGTSHDVKKRLTPGSHHVFNKGLDIVSFIPIEGSRKRHYVENHLIRALQPPMNATGVGVLLDDDDQPLLADALAA